MDLEQTRNGLSHTSKKNVRNDILQDGLTSSDYYWNSYAHFGIHEEMLKDQVRTTSYKKAIMENPHLFRDKIVLDVGCGTGILSMFAAKAGAKKVYGIDCSAIIEQARQIVHDNGFDDVIELIQGKVEEVELPVSQVDVIKPNGIILPDKAHLYLTAIEDGEYKDEKINFWENVYGFDMSCIRKLAYQEPLVDVVEPRAIVTSTAKVITVDIYTVTNQDLTFKVPFKLQAKRNDFIHALIAFFEVEFNKCHKPIRFSTAPDMPYTHWKQCVFYLEDTISICRGEWIYGTLSVAPNKKNPRDLDIEISIKFQGMNGSVNRTQQYKLR